MKITTEMVKELRDTTGAGIMDAKKALESTDGDFEKAVDLLKKKAAERMADRVDRVAAEGIIEVYSHPGNRLGVMLELNSETDFVAMNERFQSLAHDLVLHIAAMNPLYVDREDIPQDKLDQITEEFRSEAASQGKPSDIVDKIVEGRLKKYFEEVCLLEQPFVKDDEIKVKQLVAEVSGVMGENLVVRRFQRFELGEESE
jgi:elongation factor Ts